MPSTPNSPLEFWEPSHGCLSDSMLILRAALTPRSANMPWLPVGFRELMVHRGENFWLVDTRCLPAFFEIHSHCEFILHDAAAQLDAIAAAAPACDVYRFVEEDRVWDTWLLFRLAELGSTGESGPAEPMSPAKCLSDLGVAFDGHIVAGLHIDDQPWSSAMTDSLAIGQLSETVAERLQKVQMMAESAFGFVGGEWLREMSERFGPQTHHIQLKAAIALQSVTRNGLRFDPERTGELRNSLSRKRDAFHTELLSRGYSACGEGADRALQRILRRVECELEVNLERNPDGSYSTSEESLAEYRHHEFIDTLIQFRSLSSVLRLLPVLGPILTTELHPSFDVLKKTGRTSSYGEIHSQGLPRDPAFRRCIVPRHGHLFVIADFCTIEMVTLAAALTGQFGLPSQMVRLLQEGHDLHSCFASCIANVDVEQVTDAQRQKAKAINFGKPGGMGVASLRRYARVQYGVDLSEDEARKLSESWHDVFPETRPFLQFDTAHELAAALGLTPYCFQLSLNGPDAAADTPGNREPCAWLGGMCLKVLGDESPVRKNGGPYSPEEINYFWCAMHQHLMELPEAVRERISHRQPSWELRRLVREWISTLGVVTWTGRLRANAGYCAQRNTIFQGLAADGAKVALWYLWRAGYKVVNFIHDEFVIEIPDGSDLEAHQDRIQSLMIQGMQEVLPVSLPVRVEIHCGTSWAR